MPRKFRSEEEWRAFLVELMESDGRMYHKLAYGVLRDSAASEDASQQALLKALERSKSLWSARSLRAWLAKVVVHEALLVRRRREVESRVLPQRMRDADASTTTGRDWFLREELVEAIDKLPEEIRAIVVLRILNGLSGAEVKDVLDCSEAHVSRGLHTGMNLLRQTLQDWRTKAKP